MLVCETSLRKYDMSMPTHHFSVHARLVPTQQYTSSHIIEKMLEITGQILDDQLVAALSRFPTVEGLMVYEASDIFCHQATGSCCGMHCCKKQSPEFGIIFFFFFCISQWSLLILVQKTNEVGKRFPDVFRGLVTVHWEHIVSIWLCQTTSKSRRECLTSLCQDWPWEQSSGSARPPQTGPAVSLFVLPLIFSFKSVLIYYYHIIYSIIK